MNDKKLSPFSPFQALTIVVFTFLFPSAVPSLGTIKKAKAQPEK